MKLPKLLVLSILFLSFCACNAGKDRRSLTKPILQSEYTDNKEETDAPIAYNDYEQQHSDDFNYLPKDAQGTPAIILKREGYTASYNPTTKQPNWVAWKLSREHTTGPVKRNGVKFQPDNEVDNPVDTYDYMQSGFDRGHMCPAADNKWSETAMEQCFLMTNICPQLHTLNSGLWNSLENQCRNWAREYGKIYIVSGPIFTRGQHRTIGKHKVIVPIAFFEVVLCMEDTPRAIGWVVKNTVEKGHKKTEFVNTIDQVERITGIDFFPELPDNIENKVEGEANFSQF